MRCGKGCIAVSAQVTWKELKAIDKIWGKTDQWKALQVRNIVSASCSVLKLFPSESQTRNRTIPRAQVV